MWPAVASSFEGMTETHEGCVFWMYLDVKCLVTTGIGNKIDPMSDAIGLAWAHLDGVHASESEIAAEWRHVKSLTAMAPGGGAAFGRVTTLWLGHVQVDALVRRMLVAIETHLGQRFHDWETWPADAQLAAIDLAYCMGAGRLLGDFKRWCAACAGRDWSTAAVESKMVDPGNPLKLQNGEHDLCFSNAQWVETTMSDPSTLWFPQDVAKTANALP